MALPIPPVNYSPEEYMRLERAAEYKSQYVDGRICAMSGGSPRHNTIVVNVTSSLHLQVKGKSCRVYNSDTKVRTPTDNLYTYPDLTVVCGNPVYWDSNGDVLDNPTLIVEVLSPSTEAFDRGRKAMRYREIRSLTDYLLIAQNEPHVEHYSRQSNGSWVFREVSGLGSSVSLPSINCTLSLTDIYDREEFAEDNDQFATDLP